jgi:octaprenyl-diphosphate synthase
LRLVRATPPQDMQPGGKMLRPALCLLSAGACGARDLERFAPMAGVFEALHAASLAHDDVVDRALVRRGGKSLNALWDNHAAVLGGDYMVARSVELLAAYGSCELIIHVVAAVRRMAEGELYYHGQKNAPVSVEDCIALADSKTASLFAAAMAAPALFLNVPYREALGAYGAALGIAFQLIDDLLDVTQSAKRLGKPACGDITESKNTLPILGLCERLDARERERLDTMRGKELSEEDRAWVAERVEATGAGARTLEAATAYADSAKQSLSALPATPFRQSLEGLVEFVVTRAS